MSKRKTVQDFQFGSRIGEGSYSSVFKAVDVANRKIFAIKMLSKKHIVKEKKIKYVNIEKITLNRLGRHPGIVTLHYTFQDENSLYFVIDFAEQGELLTLIRKMGSLSESCSKYYMTQLIDAVDFMHKKGVIHRDLKPENILVNSERKIMITDFGAAKVLNLDEQGEIVEDEETEEAFNKGSFVGTAEYVSPELLKYNKCGFESDIWALGCILYQFIVGVPPFKGKTEYLTFEKIVNLQYQWPNFFIPELIKDIVSNTLKSEPQERLSMTQLQKHPWFGRLNWSDKSRIWAQGPPPLEPYRPLVEQQLQTNTNNFKKVIIQKKLPAATVKKNLLNSTISQIRNTDGSGYLPRPVKTNGLHHDGKAPVKQRLAQPPLQTSPRNLKQQLTQNQIQPQIATIPQHAQPPLQTSPRNLKQQLTQNQIQPQIATIPQHAQPPKLELPPKAQQSSPFQPQKPGPPLPQQNGFSPQQPPNLRNGSRPSSPQYRPNPPQMGQKPSKSNTPKSALPQLQTQNHAPPKVPNSDTVKSPVSPLSANGFNKPKAPLTSSSQRSSASPQRSISSAGPSPTGTETPAKLAPPAVIVAKSSTSTTMMAKSTGKITPKLPVPISKVPPKPLSKPPTVNPPIYKTTPTSSPSVHKPPSKSSSPIPPKKLKTYDNIPLEVLSHLDTDEEIIKMDYINSSELSYSEIRTFDPTSIGNKLSPETISLNDVLINGIITKNQSTLDSTVKRILLIITDKGNLILFHNGEYIDEVKFYLKVDLTDKAFAMYDYEFSEFSESGYLILEVLKHEKLILLSPLFKKTKNEINQHSKFLIEPNLSWIDSLLKTKEILKNKTYPSSPKKPQRQRSTPSSAVPNASTAMNSPSPRSSLSSSIALSTDNKSKPKNSTITDSARSRRVSNPSVNGIVTNTKTVYEINKQNKKFAGGAAAAAFKASR